MNEDALRELLDKQAIREMLARYCRAVDRSDESLASSCFHSDVTLELDGRKLNGAAEVARFLVERCRERSSISMHCITNELIEVDGDTAHGEFYVVSWYVIERDGRQFTRPFGGRYLPRFRRDGDSWKITDFTVVSEWARVDEVAEPWPLGPGALRGRRDREDPVYRLGAR